jgi:hypothetical protein
MLWVRGGEGARWDNADSDDEVEVGDANQLG